MYKPESPEQSVLSGEPKEDKAGQGRVGRSRTAEHWHGSGDGWRRGEYDGSFTSEGIGPSANVGMKGKCYPGLVSRKPVTRMDMLYPLT